MLRKTIMAGLCAAGILSLILDSKTALSGAQAGIALCLQTVIPSLFPFLFLCGVLTGTLWGQNSPILRFLGKKVGMPNGSESLLIAAILGGYPAGAKIIGEAYDENRLNRDAAEHLLTFCSNAGPAFVFGIIAQQFDRNDYTWAIFLIHILSAFFVGKIINQKKTLCTALSLKSQNFSTQLNITVKTMGIICGWIILFQILFAFLTSWILWAFPTSVRIFFSGLLELSGGCCMLSHIPNISLRFLLCSCFLSCGGFCVTMQTASVIGSLPLKQYLKGKGLQTLFSLILSVLYLIFGWLSLMLAIVLFLIFPKKAVDFREDTVYNDSIISERTHVHAVS